MNHKEELPSVVPQFSLRDRKVWVLIALVLLTIYVVATQWKASPAPSSAPKTAAAGPASRTPAPAAATQPVASRSGDKLDPLKSSDPVLLPQLEVDPQQFDQEQRNIFDYFVPPPPPQPKPPDPVCGDGMCNGREDYTSCAGDCPPPPPPPVCGDGRCEGSEAYTNCPSDCEPPPPPEINLKYIGYLKEESGAVAFLTNGKEVFMGRVDDIIANRYRLVRITEDGVELGYVNLKTGQSRSIPFQGNK
jgi:hypothetical protein